MNDVKISGTVIPYEWFSLPKEQFIKAILKNPDNLYGIAEKEVVLSDLWDDINKNNITIIDEEIPDKKPIEKKVSKNKGSKQKL